MTILWQETLPDRYVNMSPAETERAISLRRRELGESLLILGHHYQQDDIIQHADYTGDSLKLAQLAAVHARDADVKYIILCGVHFMAETAALLVDESIAVILPNLGAGCSMAAMADIDDVITCWEQLQQLLGEDWNGRIVPIAYVNSTAAIKAFVGERGGACCTSSNAREVLQWALRGGIRPPRAGEEIKVLFLPDQHLGRNVASALGLITEVDVREGRAAESHTAVWDPQRDNGGLTREQVGHARILLWAGYCSVHMQFRPDDVDRTRREYRLAHGQITIIVHPECRREVVDKADVCGSTERIIQSVERAPRGSAWAVGTEVHLVNRLARSAASRGVYVHMLSHLPCLCANMYRINPAHVLWVLDHLVTGEVVNRIVVPPAMADPARIAIRRMLELTALAPSGAHGQRSC